MSNTIHELLSSNPILLLFLVLAIGFFIGNLRIGSFQLGSVAGVLFAGLLLGHFGFESNASIQSFGFVLFIFSVGYQAGPKFVQAVRKDGRKYFVISVIVAVSGFLLALGFSRILNFDQGLSAGLLAGSLTSTPTLAAADAAVLSSDFVPKEGINVEEVRSNINTAYAITYIFGLVGLILIIRILPRILGNDLADEAVRLEKEESAGVKQPVFSPSDIVLNVIRVESPEITGIPLREMYEKAQIQITIQKIRRNGEIIEPTLDMELQMGDIISVVGVLNQEAVEQLSDKIFGPVVRDRELLHFQPETAKICVMRKKGAGKIVGELQTPVHYASFISKITRLGVPIDITPTTRLERGDVLDVTGPIAGLQAMGEDLGHLEQEIEETDLRTFAWAIVFGILIGTLTITVAGVKIGLGSAGGLLALGLLVGYLRSLFPVFGRVPAGAQFVFTELGLLLFMACVGLRGGADIVETLLSSGPALLLTGILVTVIPLALAYIYGRKVLNMNPLVLFGAITGSMTSGGALNVINEQSRSTIASIPYTGAYAIANVLLTIAGAIIILF